MRHPPFTLSPRAAGPAANRSGRLLPRMAPLAVSLVLAFGAGAARATVLTWNCNDGNWATAGCWSPAAVPVSGDTAQVYPIGTSSAVLRFDAASGTRSVGPLYVNSTNSATVSLLQSGGALTAAYYYVGYSGTGGVTQTGGSLSGSLLYLGNTSAGHGSYSLQGGSISLSTGLGVGNSGQGTFAQSAGTLTASSSVSIGVSSGGQGTYTLSNTGQLTTPTLVVGYYGAGTLVQSGISVVDVDYLRVGLYPGTQSTDKGTYRLTGGTLTSSVSYVGQGGSGSFEQTSGTHTAAGSLLLGYSNSGSYSLSGGTLSSNTSYVGYGAYGSFTQSGGVHDTNTLVLGDQAAGNGYYSLSGGTLNAGALVRGSGTGSFYWSRGTLNLESTVTLTESGFFGDTLTIGAGKALNTTSTINVAADGRLNQTGGGTIAAQRLDNYGQVLIEGSVLGLSSTSGSLNHGTMSFAGGTLSSTSPLTNFGTVTGNGTITGNSAFTNRMVLRPASGQLTLSTSGANANHGTIELPSGGRLRVLTNLSNHGAIDLAGGTLDYSGSGGLVNEADGVISGHGSFNGYVGPNKGLIVVGGGTLSVPGNLSNTGQIQLSGAGTALIGGGPIDNTGTLQGAGYVANPVYNSGTVEASGGTLTLASSTSGNAGNGVFAVGTGAKLLMSGGLGSNAALIQLDGGSFDNGGKALANSGRIVGNGTLRTGGLTNAGQLSLSFGDSSVAGAIANAATGTVIVSNGAQATFADALVNQGELRISAGGAANFFGQVSGSGNFNGDGEARFEGGFAPGFSPALVAVNFATTIAASSPVTMELGGTAPGSCDDCHDKIIFNNTVKLQGGPLNVVWWSDYAGHSGDRFDLFDWNGPLTGNFGQVNLPALATGLTWQTGDLYTSGEIRVVAVPEPQTWALMLAGLGVLARLARRRPAQMA